MYDAAGKERTMGEVETMQYVSPGGYEHQERMIELRDYVRSHAYHDSLEDIVAYIKPFCTRGQISHDDFRSLTADAKQRVLAADPYRELHSKLTMSNVRMDTIVKPPVDDVSDSDDSEFVASVTRHVSDALALNIHTRESALAFLNSLVDAGKLNANNVTTISTDLFGAPPREYIAFSPLSRPSVTNGALGMFSSPPGPIQELRTAIMELRDDSAELRALMHDLSRDLAEDRVWCKWWSTTSMKYKWW